MIQRDLLRNVVMVLAALSLLDLGIGAMSSVLFPVGYFDKPIVRITSDLAFVEGAGIFLVGAILSFYSSKITPRALSLMVIGAAMIGISIIFGVVH